MSWAVVDFPAPLWPIRATTSPGAAENDTWSNATLRPESAAPSPTTSSASSL